ncbi:pyrroline-5-carboxylate reductase [Paenibacillus turpanensis]|uniref:pyrroline-5-carboxylate reductase n=1 Tax=Paenibacillus turpanensis TaxID=2689078 RepID=UPI00140A8898|nr:pyrroline-5-carboxylate reductase [Paenibacillus turpanensis]
MNSMTSLQDLQLCFVGAGSMAEALVRGLIEKKKSLPGYISMTNRSNAERLHDLRMRYGVRVPQEDGSTTSESLIASADIVFLCMKPKDVVSAMDGLRPLLRPEQLIVSVVAGLSIETMQQLLGREQAVVRTMPNTSSTIGLGATGICFSASVSEWQREIAIEIFESMSIVCPVEEHLINTVTGVSGSGPAYVYYLIEAMVAAGISGGLTEEQSKQLVVQTVLGAAEMVKTTGEDPAALRKGVTSPNGTTYAALEVLAQHNFLPGMVSAVMRASDRAREMGGEIADAAARRMQEQ